MYKKDKSCIIPVIVGIGYLLWFYFRSLVFYSNNMLVKVNDVTWDNILIKLADDYIVMLLLPTIIMILNIKNLKAFKLNYCSGTVIKVLLIILIIFFFLHNDYSISGVYKFFFYLIFVSFGEEFIFRGYIYNSLKGKSKVKAVLISGILWGAAHGILPTVLNHSSIIKNMINEIGGGITTGLFFIYLQEKSGTLWVPVLIHALLDYSYLFFGQLIAIVILIYYIMTSKYVKK